MPMTRASVASSVGTLHDVASAVIGACVIVANVLLRRGMVVTWDRGKSAALVEIRGALSRSAKRELFLEHGT